MTWIKTLEPSQDHPHVAEALREARADYPPEYSSPKADSRLPERVRKDSVILSHSLIPEVMRHVASAFRALLDPALPLSRRQHEMIAATVSSINRCFY